MDRLTLSSAAVRVRGELHLDNAEYGNLEWAFGWAFAAGSLLFGLLADRVRIYLLYPAVLAGWSLMGMATGWTHDYTGLIVCRALLGFFEAGHWPCALKTTFALLSEKDRTMGNSVLQSGASIGAIVTPQIVKLMVTEQPGSWRSPFVVVGGAGLVWVLLWFLCIRPRELDRAPEARQGSDGPPLRRILLGARFWAVALLLVGAQIVWQIYRVWLVNFLQTGRGYAEKTALNIYSVYYVATDIGCILAGFASLWLIRRRASTPHDARRTVYAGACMLTSLCIFLPWLGSGWLLVSTLLVIGAGALALFPCYYSFAQEISSAHVGRITGFLSLWVWAVTSPLQTAFGKLADVQKSYDLGLVIAGLTPWIGVLSMRLLWRKTAPPSV